MIGYIDNILNNINHKNSNIDETKINPILVDNEYLLCTCPYLNNYSIMIDKEDIEEFNNEFFCKNCPFLIYLKNGGIRKEIKINKEDKLENNNINNKNSLIDDFENLNL